MKRIAMSRFGYLYLEVSDSYVNKKTVGYSCRLLYLFVIVSVILSNAKNLYLAFVARFFTSLTSAPSGVDLKVQNDKLSIFNFQG